jgi:hypothetical protein
MRRWRGQRVRQPNGVEPAGAAEPGYYPDQIENRMKLAATIARSLQADMHAELRDLERAVAAAPGRRAIA